MTASVVVAGDILIAFLLPVIALLQNTNFWQRAYFIALVNGEQAV